MNAYEAINQFNGTSTNQIPTIIITMQDIRGTDNKDLTHWQNGKVSMSE